MIFVIVILIVIAAIVVGVVFGVRADSKFREQHQIPDKAETLHYLGGHPSMAPGTVFAMANGSGLIMVSRLSGKRVEIPFTQILGIHLNSDVQTVNTGGGRSIAGAVAGGVIAGPVGAIVGGRKKTKTETIDRTTVSVNVKNSNGIETSLIFKGGQTTYNTIAKLLSASQPPNM